MTWMSELPPELAAEMTPAVRAFVKSLMAQADEMQTRMQAEIDELKAQVRKFPLQNSSVPPATVYASAAAKTKQKANTKMSRGGQKGHKRATLKLVPVEQCTEVMPLQSPECRRCGEGPSGFDPEPLRHQVWELPEIDPLIMEYQQHRLTCKWCGTTTCAELPAGVATDQFGARLFTFTVETAACGTCSSLFARRPHLPGALSTKQTPGRLVSDRPAEHALLPGIHSEDAESRDSPSCRRFALP